MYVNRAAVPQDNLAPPVATAPGVDGMVAATGISPVLVAVAGRTDGATPRS